MKTTEQQTSTQTNKSTKELLQEHARRAAEFDLDGLRERVAVPSPQGGYRMEIKDIKKVV